jgi:hypothetical protein
MNIGEYETFGCLHSLGVNSAVVEGRGSLASVPHIAIGATSLANKVRLLTGEEEAAASPTLNEDTPRNGDEGGKGTRIDGSFIQSTSELQGLVDEAESVESSSRADEDNPRNRDGGEEDANRKPPGVGSGSGPGLGSGCGFESGSGSGVDAIRIIERNPELQTQSDTLRNSEGGEEDANRKPYGVWPGSGTGSSVDLQTQSDISLEKSTSDLQRRINEAEARASSSPRVAIIEKSNGVIDNQNEAGIGSPKKDVFAKNLPKDDGLLTTSTSPVPVADSGVDPSNGKETTQQSEGWFFSKFGIPKTGTLVTLTVEDQGSITTIGNAAASTSTSPVPVADSGADNGNGKETTQQSEGWFFSKFESSPETETLVTPPIEDQGSITTTANAAASNQDAKSLGKSQNPTSSDQNPSSSDDTDGPGDSTAACEDRPFEVWENQRYYGPFIGWHGPGRPSRKPLLTQLAYASIAKHRLTFGPLAILLSIC